MSSHCKKNTNSLVKNTKTSQRNTKTHITQKIKMKLHKNTHNKDKNTHNTHKQYCIRKLKLHKNIHNIAEIKRHTNPKKLNRIPKFKLVRNRKRNKYVPVKTHHCMQQCFVALNQSPNLQVQNYPRV